MTVAVLEPAQRSQFETDGFCVVESLFSADERDAIVEHIEQAQFELMLGDQADGQLSYRPMLHLTSRALQDVACDPRWAPIVGALLGPDARLYWEQCVTKPPHAHTELPWHQDNGYTPVEPEHYLTCWLALDDATLENGCMQVIPGSHLDGTKKHGNDDGTPYFRAGAAPSVEGVHVPVRSGDVLCFSSLTMHRSGPNTTDGWRRAWIIQFCHADARSALSRKPLDDRLRVSRDGDWLDDPARDRDFDLMSVLANYDSR